RHHRDERHHPDRVVQAHRQAGLQDGAAASPLRAVRVGRGDDRHPLLAHRRVLRRAGDGRLLRRVGRQLTGSSGPVDGARVLVAGLGVTGRAVVAALSGRAASVVTVDARAQDADVVGADATDAAVAERLVAAADLVVASPGWPPSAALLTAARTAGVPVWSEVELAWRLRAGAPWLAVTGTNGKTTTVRMLASILTAAGLRTAAVGNVG